MITWTLRSINHGELDGGIFIGWLTVIISLYLIFTGHKNIVKRKKTKGYIMIVLALLIGLFTVFLKN